MHIIVLLNFISWAWLLPFSRRKYHLLSYLQILQYFYILFSRWPFRFATLFSFYILIVCWLCAHCELPVCPGHFTLFPKCHFCAKHTFHTLIPFVRLNAAYFCAHYSAQFCTFLHRLQKKCCFACVNLTPSYRLPRLWGLGQNVDFAVEQFKNNPNGKILNFFPPLNARCARYCTFRKHQNGCTTA